MNSIEKYQVIEALEGALRHGSMNLSIVPKLIRKIIEYEAWKERTLPNGKVVCFKSFRELLETKPMDGLGQDPKRVEAVIRDDAEALTMFREAMTGKHGGDRKSDAVIKDDNVMVDPVQGNSRSYTLSRLQRDHPELFKEVVDGNMSANAAAIKAGFRKKPTALEKAKQATAKLTAAEWAELIEWRKAQD